jgi:hypothetical protein
MTVWHDAITGSLGEGAVDMTLRLGSRGLMILGNRNGGAPINKLAPLVPSMGSTSLGGATTRLKAR